MAEIASPAAAPPAAPASAPPPAVSAPPPPTASPASKETATPAGASWLDDVGKDLESLSASGDEKGEPKPAKDGELAKAGEVVPPRKPEGEASPKPGEEQPAKPMKAATLRQAFDDLKKEKREVLEPKIQQLESKLKELESNGGQVPRQVMEKMTAIEKRNAELESHIEFLDFQKSNTFKTKYQQPYSEAYFKAVSDFQQLTVRVPGPDVGEDGQPIYVTRPATDKDLLYLANLDLSQMDEQAEAMFGKSAPRVIRHVERVRELAEAQDKAIHEAQTKSGEVSKTRKFQMQQFQQQQHALWETYNNAIAQKFPEVFGPAEGDNEGNALLKRGFEEADRLFAPAPDAKPMSTEERIQFHAKLRNKIANHDRLFRRLKTVQAELDEARASLAEYEKSEPAAGRGGAPGAPTKGFMEEVDAELEKMDKR